MESKLNHPLRRIPSTEARQLLEEHRGSGQSIAAFARSKGVPAWSLYNAQAAVRRRTRQGSEARLTEVRVVDEPAEPGGQGVIKLTLPSGLTIGLARDFDEVTLRRVLGILASC